MKLAGLAAAALAGLAAAQNYSAANNLNYTGDCYTEQPAKLVSDRQWDLLVRYAKICAITGRISRGLDCATPPLGATVVKALSINATDTQAVIFRVDADDEIIVSFPGTSGDIDYQTDFDFFLEPFLAPGIDCPECTIHRGFLRAYNSIAQDIIDIVTAEVEKKPCSRISITGHSLGGALAGVAYPSLKGLGLPVHRVYSYGSPRIFSNATANYINRLALTSNSFPGFYWRVTHDTDGVPNLPRAFAGFNHAGTEFFQKDNADNVTLESTTYRCYGKEAPDCNIKYAEGECCSDQTDPGFIQADHGYYSGIYLGALPGCGLDAAAKRGEAEAAAASYLATMRRK